MSRPTPSRRSVLRVVAGFAVVGPFAGCSTLSNSSEESPGLGKVEILNLEETNQTVEVEIRQGGSVAFTETYQMDGEQPEDVDTRLVDLSWRDDGEPFVIRARRDDAETWRELRSEDAEDGCLGVTLSVERGTVIVLSGTHRALCEDAPSSA